MSVPAAYIKHFIASIIHERETRSFHIENLTCAIFIFYWQQSRQNSCYLLRMISKHIIANLVKGWFIDKYSILLNVYNLIELTEWFVVVWMFYKRKLCHACKDKRVRIHSHFMQSTLTRRQSYRLYYCHDWWYLFVIAEYFLESSIQQQHTNIRSKKEKKFPVTCGIYFHLTLPRNNAE